MCALAIKSPELIDNYQGDILRVIDYIHAAVSVNANSKIE